MKYLSLISRLFVALMVISFVSSCGSDDGLLGDSLTPATVSFSDDAGFLVDGSTIAAGDMINVRLVGSAGDSLMQAITIRTELGDLVDPATVMYDGALGQNPYALFGTDQESFTFDISFPAHADGTETYEFAVSDFGGETETAFLGITVTNTGGTAPTIALVGTNPVEQPAGSLFGANLVVDAGVNDLSTIEVLKNGTTITDIADLRYGDATNAFDANPYSIPVADASGFDKLIYFRVQNTEGSSCDYSFVVTDAAGETATYVLTVTTPVTETALSATYPGVLLQNAASPFATGGIDLETGTTVSVNSADADIIDSGNDSATGEWFRTIEPNGSTILRSVNLAEFSYATVNSVEALEAAHDASQGIAQSATVLVGDTFTAQVGGTYFIMIVTAVDVQPDNTDSYTFDIKKS